MSVKNFQKIPSWKGELTKDNPANQLQANENVTNSCALPILYFKKENEKTRL